MSGPVAAGGTVPGTTRRRVVLPFAIVTLIWGSTWLVIRDQLGVVPPSWSVTYRFLVAAVAMFAYARMSGAQLRIGRGAQGVALAIGLCQFVLNFNFVYRAEHHVTSGLVAVLFALLIVPNAVLGRVFLGERISRPFLLGSAVAMLGMALLFHHELARAGTGAAAVATGIGFSLAAVLSASVANVVQALPRARGAPIASLVAWAMLWGAMGDAAWAWATVGPPAVEARAGYWAGVAWLGLAGSAVAFPLYYRVIRVIGPSRAAYSSILVPVIAMALSTLFEAYLWSIEAAAGGGLVLIGLLIALGTRRA